jgi:anaerobic magnesium-protoporphyrin IX monomethyl ester cyclase
MRVLLVGSELEENLPIRYLASSLERAGHGARLAPFSSPADAPRVLAEIERHTPDLIGLSMTFQRRAEEFGALATQIRGAGFERPLIAGGHFPTFAHTELLGA